MNRTARETTHAKFSLTALLAGAFFMLWPGMAAGQGQCRARDDVLELLAKKYQETPIAAGVTNKGGLVEVLSDIKSGTWTIIITTPQGTSCLVAAGEGWRSFEPVEPEGPAI